MRWLVFSGVALFSGCTREFTCGCTDFDNGPFYYTVEARNADEARAICESPGGDCTLETGE